MYTTLHDSLPLTNDTILVASVLVASSIAFSAKRKPG